MPVSQKTVFRNTNSGRSPNAKALPGLVAEQPSNMFLSVSLYVPINVYALRSPLFRHFDVVVFDVPRSSNSAEMAKAFNEVTSETLGVARFLSLAIALLGIVYPRCRPLRAALACGQ